MKVEDNRRVTTKCFNHLSPGEVFCYKTVFYMKVPDCDFIHGNSRRSGNSIALTGVDGGKLFLIPDSSIVDLVDATLVIN